MGRGNADPRNISDKQFLSNSIRTLIEYLTRHNFDHAINPKILTRPAVKDFQNIVMFLFRQIDPNFTSSGKFEDEVVTVFKHLGYPYQISKANIAAVGSPHAWPSLLASVMWLIELLSYDEVVAAGEAQQQQLLFQEGGLAADPDLATDPSASEKAFQAYLGTAYALFMTGEDDRYADCEENFVGSYETVNASIREQITELELRNQALAEEIENVQKRREELPVLQAREKDYEKDLTKFQQLVEQLERHKEQLEGQVAGREGELSKLQASISTLNHELDALRDRINTQELSPEDVKRMVGERDQLQASQEQASEARQQLQRRVWESEMMLRDRVQALEDSARAYNAVAEDLKVVPHTARHARGRNLNLDVDVRAKKRDGLLKTDVRRDILPALQELRTEFVAASASLRNQCLLEKDALEDLGASASELDERRQLNEGKLRRAEETYKREREQLDQAAEMHAKEMEAMDARLLRLRDTAAQETRAAAAARRVQEARVAREVRIEEHQRKVKEITAAIMDVVAVCAEHREMVQQRLGEVRELYVERLESLLTGAAAEAVANFASMAEEAYSAADYYGAAPAGVSEGVMAADQPPTNEEEEDRAAQDISLADVLSSPYAATFSPQGAATSQQLDEAQDSSMQLPLPPHVNAANPHFPPSANMSSACGPTLSGISRALDYDTALADLA